MTTDPHIPSGHIKDVVPKHAPAVPDSTEPDTTCQETQRLLALPAEQRPNWLNEFLGDMTTPPIPANITNPLLEVAMANTAHGKKNARLHFPLDRVLAAAEHAAAAPSHQLGYGETEAAPRLWWIKSDGTCLMSNGRTPTSTPGTPDDSEYLPTTVHADGWGPGTDARSILGGDDFRQSLDLTAPLNEDGTTLLGMLRAAAADGATRFTLHAVFDDRDMELTYITE